MSIEDKDLEAAEAFPALAVQMAELAKRCQSPLAEFARLERERARQQERANQEAVERVNACEALAVTMVECQRLRDVCRQLENTLEAVHKAHGDLEGQMRWLEAQAKQSPSGVTLDWCRFAEDGRVVEHGYRVSRHHLLGDRCATLREAIESTRNKQCQGKLPICKPRKDVQ